MAGSTSAARAETRRNTAEESPTTQASDPRRRRLFAYLVGVATVLVGTLCRLWLDPVLGEHHPFTLYFAAVAITAWYGGFNPALLATLLSYFAADWFFIKPRFEFNLPHTDVDEFMALLAFLFSCFAIAITSNKMRQALARSREKQRELEREIVERERVQEALKAAQQKLRVHAEELEEHVRERTAHLQETVRSLEGVCYHIAHDLRAPLRAMDGFTNILLTDYASRLEPPALSHLTHISKASQRMDLLIHGLLEYGRLGTERFPLKPLNAKLVLDRLLESLRATVNLRQAEVKVGSGWLPVVANGALLETVFSNLLSNALKFMPPERSPSITVSIFSQEFSSSVAAENRPRIAKIIVKDNGIGIPSEYFERVFKIFERLHGRDEYPGTGMGLAIAAKAVELMDGRIGVESTIGTGSSFWFELPLAANPEESQRHNPKSFVRERAAAILH